MGTVALKELSERMNEGNLGGYCGEVRTESLRGVIGNKGWDRESPPNNKLVRVQSWKDKGWEGLAWWEEKEEGHLFTAVAPGCTRLVSVASRGLALSRRSARVERRGVSARNKNESQHECSNSCGCCLWWWWWWLMHSKIGSLCSWEDSSYCCSGSRYRIWKVIQKQSFVFPTMPGSKKWKLVRRIPDDVRAD